jgi:hypothetical protein
VRIKCCHCHKDIEYLYGISLAEQRDVDLVKSFAALGKAEKELIMNLVERMKNG